MAGLREKQKANRRRLIEAAAGKLFQKNGFVDTTIEDIAEVAVVSAATVYNYYGTKGDLLLALVATGEEGISEGPAAYLVRAEKEDPADLICDVILANIDDTLTTLSRPLWAHVVAYVATTPDDKIGPDYIRMISEPLAAVINDVLCKCVALGKLKDELDTHALADMLTRLERIHFLNHVYMRANVRADLATAIHKDVSLALSAWVAA